MPITVVIKFAEEANKKMYKEAVLGWLAEDYYEQEQPKNHFFCNSEIIADYFDQCNALVALDGKEVIAFMIWTMRVGVSAEIEIVEVKKQYQKQGVFKKMLGDFSTKHPDITVLSASVIPQSQTIFSNMGWQAISSKYGADTNKRFLKIIKPVMLPLNELPSGRVIAICNQDYYKVDADPEKFKESMQYFAIDLDGNAKLNTPIAINFNSESYVGIYFNKKLITRGKPKHVFEKETYFVDANLLIIGRIAPNDPKPFSEAGFFDVDTDVDTNVDANVDTKRRRVEEQASSYKMGAALTLLPPPREALSASSAVEPAKPLPQSKLG